MTLKSSMIFTILFMTVQFCTAQIHPEQRTIPIVSDEHGILHFGDPFEHNETTKEHSPIDEPELKDGAPLSADFSRELDVELSPLHISQPQAIGTLLTDEEIELFSADLSQPVYTFVRSAEVHHNIAVPEAHHQEVSSILSQEAVTIHKETERIDVDLGTLLACGDLGSLSIDGINVEQLGDLEMEISLNDTSQVGNASMTCDRYRLNTTDQRAHLQISTASFESTNKKVRNVDEQRDTNMACPGFSGSASGQKLFKFDMHQKQQLTANGCWRHKRRHTGEKPFRCDICQKQFCVFNEYQTHRQVHTGEKPILCEICPKQFRISSSYKTHRRTHTGEKPFKCDFCQKEFSDGSNYQRHRRIHSGEKPFQCDICPKRFGASSGYQKHRRAHNEKPFQCDICPKRFCTSDDYQKHRRTHTEEKPFQCDFCRKKLSDPSKYEKHRRAHIEEKPLQCDICAKQFRYPSEYQTHLRIHTGEKPFKCDFCQKTFSNPSSCQRHLRIHTGKKPFQCDVCPKQFCTSSNFQKHRRTHIGKKSPICDLCSQDFRSKRALTIHVRKCSSRNVSSTAIE